jgi:hypothetical protein
MSFQAVFVIFLFVVTYQSSGGASAQELILLSIGSDLIGEIDELDTNATATELLSSYYARLPETAQSALGEYDGQLEKLIVDYEIARTAADSAELTEIISDMDAAWIEIQKIHSAAFTSAVTQLLDDAYGELYPVL